MSPCKRMAIIRRPKFGVNKQAGEVGLSFDAMLNELIGAPQFLSPAAAADLLDDYDAADVSELDGKPLWVEVRGVHLTIDGPCLV